MDIYDRAEKIESAQDFTEFIRELYDGFEKAAPEWKEEELKSYIEAMSGYRQESDLDEATWREFAEIILASLVYE